MSPRLPPLPPLLICLSSCRKFPQNWSISLHAPPESLFCPRLRQWRTIPVGQHPPPPSSLISFTPQYDSHIRRLHFHTSDICDEDPFGRVVSFVVTAYRDTHKCLYYEKHVYICTPSITCNLTLDLCQNYRSSLTHSYFCQTNFKPGTSPPPRCWLDCTLLYNEECLSRALFIAQSPASLCRRSDSNLEQSYRICRRLSVTGPNVSLTTSIYVCHSSFKQSFMLNYHRAWRLRWTKSVNNVITTLGPCLNKRSPWKICSIFTFSGKDHTSIVMEWNVCFCRQRG